MTGEINMAEENITCDPVINVSLPDYRDMIIASGG